MTDLEAMGRQLSEADEWLSELAATRRFLKDVLRRYWDEDAMIRNSIARTHENIDGDDGCVFVVGWKRFDRLAMFSRLDALNAEYASFKMRYFENGRLIKHATKSRSRIADAIEREQRRIQNKIRHVAHPDH